MIYLWLINVTVCISSFLLIIINKYCINLYFHLQFTLSILHTYHSPREDVSVGIIFLIKVPQVRIWFRRLINATPWMILTFYLFYFILLKTQKKWVRDVVTVPHSKTFALHYSVKLPRHIRTLFKFIWLKMKDTEFQTLFLYI